MPIRSPLRSVLSASLLAALSGHALAGADLLQRLDALAVKLEQKRQEYHVPGLTLVVLRGNPAEQTPPELPALTSWRHADEGTAEPANVIYYKALGLKDVESNTPMSVGTLFAIGSSTKAFTATLCGMMVDEGKMRWDEPARTHLPELHFKELAADEGATIRDMLCHRTGLTRTDLAWAGGKASRAEVLAAIARAEPVTPFRTKWNYNNVMFLGAGIAAANAAGTDWDAMVRDRIFAPLGMKNSNTDSNTLREYPRASKGYAWQEDKASYKHLPPRELAPIAPAGAINSTVIDMKRWLDLQLGKGEVDGKRLVKAETIEETWKKQIDMGQGDYGYGLGWMLHDWNGKRVVEHGGNIDGFACEVGMLPDEKLGFVLLCNVTATPLQSEIQGMVWEAFFPPAETAAGGWPTDKLSPLTGKYKFEQMGIDCTVSVKDSKLFIDVPGQMNFELKWPGEDGKWPFAMTDAIKIAFNNGPDGKPASITLFQAGLEFKLPKHGVEAAPEPGALPAAELASYLGKYRFEKAGQDWPVLNKDGRLAIDAPGQMVFVLKAPDADGKWAFEVKPDIQVRFNKNDKGEVQSFTLFQEGHEVVMPRIAGSEMAALPSIDDLMSKRLAIAGPEALAKLGPARLTGTVDMVNQGVSGPVSTLFHGIERFNVRMDFGVYGAVAAASDGERVWMESMAQPFEELTGEERDNALKQFAAASFTGDLRTYYDTVEVTAVEEFEGTKVAVVKATSKDGKRKSKQFLNLTTGLPLKEETAQQIPGMGALPVTITFRDYKDFGGTLLPMRMTTENPATGKTEIAYEKCETSLSLPPDAFVLKPSAK